MNFSSQLKIVTQQAPCPKNMQPVGALLPISGLKKHRAGPQLHSGHSNRHENIATSTSPFSPLRKVTSISFCKSSASNLSKSMTICYEQAEESLWNNSTNLGGSLHVGCVAKTPNRKTWNKYAGWRNWRVVRNCRSSVESRKKKLNGTCTNINVLL